MESPCGAAPAPAPARFCVEFVAPGGTNSTENPLAARERGCAGGGRTLWGMAGHHFRAGIVAIVRRADGQVLAFERADVPGQWQLPQGGLERGEDAQAAAWRELEEETGLGPAHVDLVHGHDEWVVTAWPDGVVGSGGRLGQAQRWFEFRPHDDGVTPRPDGREFRAWKWVEPAWLVDHVVAFKRPAYARMLAAAAERATGAAGGG
jgi:putative (di)nucleoside polyphosphate hydrolase